MPHPSRAEGMKGLDERAGASSTERASTGVLNGNSMARDPPLTLLDRLRLCKPAWALGGSWDRERAHAALRDRHTGSFLVLCDSATCPHLLCVSVGGCTESVRDFAIEYTGKVFHLPESHLGFSDLIQLVAFYTVSRDVLPCCLSIPTAVYSLSMEQMNPLVDLGPSPNVESNHVTGAPLLPPTGLTMCSIQVTSANGALCIINPLFLHEHGDDWLTKQSPLETSQAPSARAANRRRERRLSTTRPWGGAGIQNKRTFSVDKEQEVTEPSSTEKEQASGALQSPPCSPGSVQEVVLRRKTDALRRGGSSDLPTPELLTPGSPSPTQQTDDPGSRSPPAEPSQRNSGPQSPHRVSWIEDGVWLSPPSPVHSLLTPLGYELDSLSISSTEEEMDVLCGSLGGAPAAPPHGRLSLALADKVKHRFSAFGQVIGGLVSAQKRLSHRAQELCERRAGGFGEQARAFLEHALRGCAPPAYPSGSELLQDVRHKLTGLREALLDAPEIQGILDSLGDTPDWELDAMLELTLHKIVLKPLCPHLYSCLHDYRSRDGTLQRLSDNQQRMRGRSLEELGGSSGVGVPDAVAMEKIQQRLAALHQAYSPSKKVQHLLKICKSIYQAMSSGSGAVYGADDFLPCLTWVCLRSDISQLQLNTDYMMELLDPGQLQGEGGYYLTSVYATLFHVSTFRPRLAARQVSVEAQQSINQWHRRRTLHSGQARGRGRGPHRGRLQGEGPGHEAAAQEDGAPAAAPDERPGPRRTPDAKSPASELGVLREASEELDSAPVLQGEPADWDRGSGEPDRAGAPRRDSAPVAQGESVEWERAPCGRPQWDSEGSEGGPSAGPPESC
ncbi:ras and Rab interactor 2 isoform X2 [Lepisosteus oculatus]|uniref:ras and Rab interactor 2 isoform X2 n=1 Tax=Lepisosteus oculatus TaxID=7918 RepID=UPI00371FAFC0